MDKEQAIEICNEIIKQLGGYGRLKAMIAFHSHYYEIKENGDMVFYFQFKGSRIAKFCTITYHPTDLYSMKIFKITGGYFRKDKWIELKEVITMDDSNLYDDMLKPMFEEATGLRLSL